MSEDNFFAKLFNNIPNCPEKQFPIGPGDDCAAIKIDNENYLLIAADQIIATKHYTLDTPAKLVGKKLLARNISDVAAMGGTPTSCVVCLAADAQHATEKWMLDFYQGIIDEAEKYQIHMIGGDIATTPNDCVASLTIVGKVKHDLVLQRNGAQEGDLLCCTGELGNSFITDHHLLFTPRLHEGKWLAENKFCNAMIDISDGLAIDGSRIATASKLGLIINIDQLPRRANADDFQALYDGEDYELLFAVSPQKIEKLQKEWKFATKLTIIGQFIKQQSIFNQLGEEISLNHSWDHLKK